jgi:hypothetical protein
VRRWKRRPTVRSPEQRRLSTFDKAARLMIDAVIGTTVTPGIEALPEGIETGHPMRFDPLTPGAAAP